MAFYMEHRAVLEKGHLLTQARLTFHGKHPESCGNTLFSAVRGELDMTGGSWQGSDSAIPAPCPPQSTKPPELSPKISMLGLTSGCSAGSVTGLAGRQLSSSCTSQNHTWTKTSLQPALTQDITPKSPASSWAGCKCI